MGSPCEPLSERQEKIARLEELGFDAVAPRPDWRDILSNAEIDAAIAQLDPGTGSIEPFDPSDELDWPDIGELVEALREIVPAAEAITRVHAGDLSTRLATAAAKGRDLLTRIDRMAEETYRAD